MAKGVKKTVSVYLDGKQVENSAKSIGAAIAKLTNEMNKAEIGSDKYVESARKIQELRKIINEHNAELKSTGNTLDWLKKKTAEWQGFVQAVFFGQKFTKTISNWIEGYTDSYKTLDDALTNVEKYTGLSRKEVEALNEELKKIDTRAPVEELNRLAGEAGRLGIQSKAEILEFVEAANMINVAIGEDLGSDAVKEIGKLAEMFGDAGTMGLRGAMLSTGSAINELAQNSSAAETYILEFTNKLAGTGKQAGMTQAEIMGLASVFDQNAQEIAVSSTTISQLLMKLYQEPAKFAKMAGMDVKMFAENMKKDANAAMLSFVETLSQKGGLADLAPIFKELGLDGTRASGILSVLAGNVDKVRAAQELATKAFADGTSIMEEYDRVNNNSAAALEKAQNRIQEAKAELGESLMPIMIRLTEGTASFTKVLADLFKVVVDNPGAFTSLASATGVYFLWQSKSFILGKAKLIQDRAQLAVYGFQSKAKRQAVADELAEKAALEANTLAEEKNRLAKFKKSLETAKGGTITRLNTKIVAQESVVKLQNAAATQAQVKAENALKIARAATPWGAILMGATLAFGAFKALASNTNAAKDAMKEFNKESAKQEAEAKHLFNALKTTEKGGKDYHAILTKLKELYPDIITSMINEKGELDNINEAYKAVTASIREKIATQMQEKAITEVLEESLKKQKKVYDTIQSQLEKQTGKEVASIITSRIVEGIENGNIKEVMEKLKKEFTDIDFENQRVWWSGLNIEQLADRINTLNNIATETTANITQSFSNMVPEKPLSELEQLEKRLKGVEQSLGKVDAESEYGKMLQRTIDNLKEKIALLKESKDESGVNTVTGETPTEKELKKWEEFNKKVLKLQTDKRIALLSDFEKERAQIEAQYNELIKEAEEFGKKNAALAGEAKKLAEKLEAEKGEAVIAAGQKYMEKYADITKKFQEEMVKLAEKTEVKQEESRLIQSLLGSDREWNVKIRAIETHLKELEEMYNNGTSNAERAQIQAQQVELWDAEVQAITQREQAKANIIKKYAQGNADFVIDKEMELSLAGKSEKDKEIEKIRKHYDERIKLEEKTLDGMIQLQKAGDKTISDENIKHLEELIKKLGELRDREIEVVIKSEGNVWEQLSNFDWGNFAADWQKGLGLIAQAGQELADGMNSIWNSINQIAINNMQKELDAFKEKKDEELKIFTNTQKSKKKGLDDQVAKGIISQEYYNAQIEKMEEERAAKEEQLAAEKAAKELAMKKEQFRREKQAAITQAIIQGALSVATTLAQWGLPWGLIPAGIAAGMTIAQVALISSQPEPYQYGGFTGKKKNKLIQVNEAGEEWIASNILLKDKTTAPIISALDEYQKGNRSLLDNMYVSTPNQNILSQAASNIGGNFASPKSQTIIEKHYVTSETNTQTNYEEMTAAILKLTDFLEHHTTLKAVISRKFQNEYDEQEDFLRQLAKV